jgi:hypothetical protein
MVKLPELRKQNNPGTIATPTILVFPPNKEHNLIEERVIPTAPSISVVKIDSREAKKDIRKRRIK